LFKTVTAKWIPFSERDDSKSNGLTYGLLEATALRLPSTARIYPPVFAVGGLCMCIFLAFWVEWKIWVTSLGILFAGLVWHLIFQQIKLRKSTGQ